MDFLLLDPQFINLADEILLYKIISVPLQVLHFLQLKPHLLVILHNRYRQQGLPAIIPVPVLLADHIRRDDADLVIETKRFF